MLIDNEEHVQKRPYQSNRKITIKAVKTNILNSVGKMSYFMEQKKSKRGDLRASLVKKKEMKSKKDGEKHHSDNSLNSHHLVERVRALKIPKKQLSRSTTRRKCTIPVEFSFKCEERMIKRKLKQTQHQATNPK